MSARFLVFLLVVASALTGPVLAWDWSNPNLNASDAPSRYFRVEVAQLGVDDVGIGTRLLKLDYIGGRFRAGVSLANVWLPEIDELDLELAPVHVGFTIASLPLETDPIWSRAVDAYVEAELGGFGNLYGLRTIACLDAEYSGFGVGICVGWRDFYHQSYYAGEWSNELYVGLRFRLLTFSFGLNEPAEPEALPPHSF